MSSDWKAVATTTLIDAGALAIGDGFRAKNDEMASTGLPFARAGNIDGGNIHLEGADLLGPDSVEKAGEKIARPGDSLFTSKGTVGRFAYVGESTPPFVYSPQICYWRVLDRSILEPEFIYFWLQGPESWEQLRALKGQTDMADYVSLADQRQMKITLPPIDEQRRIAGVLAALENSIRVNAKLSNGLLQAGGALFDSACDESADEVIVDDVVTFHNKHRVPLSAQQRAEMPGPYPYYGATGIFDYVDRFLFDGTFVLVGEDGSVVQDGGSPVTQYVWGKFWVNNHAHVLTGLGISTELAYLALTRADVRAHITGAVQPKLSMGNLRSVQLRIPGPSSRSRLEVTLKPVFSLIRSKRAEAATLAQLRDALLPKLVSGEVPVPNGYEPVERLGLAP